jgi:hypothetical protein
MEVIDRGTGEEKKERCREKVKIKALHLVI